MTAARWTPIDGPRLPARLETATPDRLDLELDRAAVVDCDFVGAQWDDVDISESQFTRVAATATAADRFELTDVGFDDCELSGLSVNSASLVRVRFRQCRMAGVTMPSIRARHVGFEGCNMAGAWLRAGQFERCEFVDCDLREADFYEATILHSRFLRCRLDGAELSAATVRAVALHGCTFDGLRGIDALRNVVIGSDQIMTLGVRLLATLGVTFDDDFGRDE